MRAGSQEIPCHIFVITHHCNIFRPRFRTILKNESPPSLHRSCRPFADVLISRRDASRTGNLIGAFRGRKANKLMQSLKSAIFDGPLSIVASINIYIYIYLPENRASVTIEGSSGIRDLFKSTDIVQF